MGTNILNPFEIFPSGEVPIMSFQTDLNGTFNPVMIIASGTLKWIIDGEEFISNAPSKVLTGSIVDVQVFANDVAEGAISTSFALPTLGIIGTLDFSHFTFTDTLLAFGNPSLTEIIFSSFSNTLSNTRVYSCDLSSIDFSNVLLTGTVHIFSNSNLANVTFSTGANVISTLQAQLCSYTSLDLSNVLLTSLFYTFNNSSLTSITFSTGANVINIVQLQNCNYSSIDFSNVTIGGIFFLFNNPNLTTVQLSGLYESGLSDYRYNADGLNLASVNLVFFDLNTYMSANAPTSNLTLNISGGTNASPTGGSSNTDLVNLRDVVYPEAGFTFTANIN